MVQRQSSSATATKILVIVTVLAAAFGGASIARAADAVCTGSLSGNVAGNVYVGSGVSCTISQANIGGNVQLKSGAALFIDGRQYPSVIGGSVLAQNCAFALLEGAVTVHGNVVIQRCTADSGFTGPGIVVGGNFLCTDNSAACDANLGEVAGDVTVNNNHSTAASNISQTSIGGGLQCQQNTPAPTHAYGPDRVAGILQDQCASSQGFAPSASVSQCSVLATDPAFGLAGNPLIASATSTLVAATPTNAAFCNVQLMYSSISDTAYGYAPSEAQAIRIGIGLPLNSADGGAGGVQGAWNGKIQNLGGGGLVGSVGSTTSATSDGYVGSSTDGGHTTAQNGARGTFGVIQATNQLDRGKIIDYIIESIHQQVEWSKLVSLNYYNTKPARNYWNGCSTGGRQGLALARYYGNEFDGFLVGAPAFFHDEFRFSDAWPWLTIKDLLVTKGQTLTTAQYTAASNAAIAACQVQNGSGVADGYLDDPRSCTFDASANICGSPGAPPAPNCLTADQAQAINMIWDGPRNHLGQKIWHPMERGSSIGVGFATIPSSAAQVMSWDHRDLNFNTNLLFSSQAAIAAAGSPVGAVTYEDEATLGSNTTNDLLGEDANQIGTVDLAKNHGAKIIMWQGTSDQLIRWRDSLDFYRRAAVNYSGTGSADFVSLQPWFRYYHAPGAFHCATGLGPAPILTRASAPGSIFGALVDWVENGHAPDTILAQGGSVSPTRTRPLCPWPTTAIYNGSGSTEVASNFHCGGNLDANPVAACKMLRTEYKLENRGPLDGAGTGLDSVACAGLD
jgi:Tannase and feruloyl esterase